jgi:hypothetical protein
MNAPLEIFEAAIKSLNDDIPAQTKLEIPRAPLVCITTLIGDEGGTSPHCNGNEEAVVSKRPDSLKCRTSNVHLRVVDLAPPIALSGVGKLPGE